ncbi:MAG: YdeI/OmpD-associated family protein [Bacteroidota bacterium]
MAIERSFTVRIDDLPVPEYGYMQMMPVPPEVADAFTAKKVKRLVASVNGHEHFHCALTSMGDGHYGVMLSQGKQDKFGVWEGETFQVTLLEDESEYGMPMPAEWEEVMAVDEAAWEAFQQLTPGRKRSVLYQVGSAKREETRIERALRIAENLKLGFTNPKDFMRKL